MTFALKIGVGLLVVALLFSGPVLAADAAGTTIDLSPLLSHLAEVAFALLSVLASWVAAKARRWVDEQTAEKVRGYLDAAMRNALALAVERLSRERADLLQVDVRSRAVAEAATYVLATVPDALRYFGIDGPGLEARLEARLGLVAPLPGVSAETGAALSPAVP